jgi:DNA polymerase-3 subunit alpha
MKTFYSIHHHSRYSLMDGRGTVADHVRRAKELGYPALALTDHGTMAGAVELYRECKRNGIVPLPGIEAYASYGLKTRKTFHLGLVATTEQGYLNLVTINNAMARDFYYKPILDLTRIGDLPTEGVVLTTGCFFGVAMSASRVDPEAPLNVISTLADYFDVYVEAQCHGIEDEDHDDVEDQYKALAWAKQLGLPMVIGQDCHYVYKTDRNHHDTMKRLGSWNDDPDSAIFPGEYGYHLQSEEELRAQFEPEVWREGLKGLSQILAGADMSIPPLDKFDPVIISRPDEEQEIVQLVLGSDRMPPADHPDHQEYRDRVDQELDVISGFGFTGYMLLVKEITDFMRSRSITYNVRGSAAGSLVCYLLGISKLDPIAWDLLFDRFLSRNRAKLPDIDLDVDSSRRPEVLEHLRRTYVVTGICQYSTLGIVDYDGRFKGSALQKWKQAQRKTGGSEVADRRVFEELELMTRDDAILATRGAHPSGYIVAPDEKSMRWMPLGVIGSAKDYDRFVTAFDQDSAEAMGYIKVDVLGLKAMHAVDVCLSEIERSTGKRIELEDIPLDDADVYTIIGDGMTSGVFQLEGWAAKKGCVSLKPKRIEEIIAAMALFRPAAMDSGATELYVKRSRSARSSAKPQDYVKAFHPDIADVIRPTYGVLVYQEQVIEILKALQFGPDELGDALKAIKASNSKVHGAQEIVRRLLEDVHGKAEARGWSVVDEQWLENAFKAYANYGFNMAHATAYGILAYQTAWLSFHYPAEFWKGMITAHGKDDEKVAEYTDQLASRMFTRMPVDVNYSGVTIRVNGKRRWIHPALTTIPGIGENTARAIEAAAPFDDIADFATKLNGSCVSGIKGLLAGEAPEECSGAVRVLATAGALRSLI